MHNWFQNVGKLWNRGQKTENVSEIDNGTNTRDHDSTVEVEVSQIQPPALHQETTIVDELEVATSMSERNETGPEIKIQIVEMNLKADKTIQDSEKPTDDNTIQSQHKAPISNDQSDKEEEAKAILRNFLRRLKKLRAFESLRKYKYDFLEDCKVGNIDRVENTLKRSREDFKNFQQSLLCHFDTDTWDSPLHLACQNGHIKVVEVIIDCCKEEVPEKEFEIVNRVNKENQTPLHQAADQGRTLIVQKLLSTQVDVGKQDNLGNTALHYAALKGHRVCLEEILKTTELILDIANEKGQTALHLACQKGGQETVIKLLQRGANVKLKDKQHRAAIHHASFGGQCSVVKELLKEEYNVDFLEEDTQNLNPLEIALNNYHSTTAQLLWEHDRSQDLKLSAKGWSPLHEAVFTQNFDRVKQIIEEKTTVCEEEKTTFCAELKSDQAGDVSGMYETLEKLLEAKDQEFRTPLLLAFCSGSQPNIVKFLIEHRAQLQTKDQFGMTPLHMIACNGNKELLDLEVFTDTKQTQLCPNAETSTYFKTPLYLAAERDQGEVISKLLEFRADPLFKGGNVQGWTPLHAASYLGCLESAQALIEHGIKVGNYGDLFCAEDESEQLPLHLAIRSQHSNRCAMVKKLVIDNAMCLVSENQKNSVLHLAISSLINGSDDDLEFIKQLVDVEHSGNFVATDCKGTALHLAVQNNHKKEIVELLAKNKNLLNAKKR